VSKLADIPVTVELASGNVEPLLHEIGHALERLLNLGQASVIDLRGVPLAPGEEARILEFLGRGEVSAQLDAVGLSTVNESRFAGVWVVTHHDATGEVVGRLIEVTFVPDILRSQVPEMRESRERIARQVALVRAPAAVHSTTAQNTDGAGAVTVLEER
jgi:hydrogenase-1 operon protein HyaF